MSTGKNRKTAFAGTSSRGTSIKTSVRKSVPPASVDKKSIYGGASRTILSSSSRRNIQGTGSEKLGGTGKPVIQVWDDGIDVTPLSLLQTDPNAVRQKQSNILADSSQGTPTDLMSQASMYQGGTVTQSTFGGGPFTRSVFSASQSGRSTGSITDDLMDLVPAPEKVNVVKYIPDEQTPEELTEEDLEKVVNVELEETETIWLLDLPGVCVSSESDDAVLVQEQNQRYQELVKSRVGNDRYMERGMNTFNQPPKAKSIQTTKIVHTDVGVNASEWDMYDTYKFIEEQEAKEEEEQDEDEAVNRPDSQAEKEKGDREKDVGDQASNQQKSALESQGTILSMMGTDSVFNSKESGIVAGTTEQKEVDPSAILESEAFRSNLVIMERAVNLNAYQPRQAAYRGFQIVDDIDVQPEEEEKPKTKTTATTATIAAADLGPNLDRLWAYQCPLSKGRNVSCLAWNKMNPDLLAVGYGQFEFNKQKSGLVCCWSLKNPEYPERVYTFEAGVTSLDFSQAHPNLLAVGLYDGTVAICNVRSLKDEPVLDSVEASGKHLGPVWQLRWIEKERGSGEERMEVLVTVSTDGRITQWSIRKGLECYDLMKLKRVQGRQSHGRTRKTEALISKHAGGLCFDFNYKDTNLYLAGTEDGHIHRCSCSYNEQYLDSYFGHSGPVYHIEWSPFNPEVFLSCSGDWSIRLWHQDSLQPILNFFSSTKSVPDVTWSPQLSTVFACVNEGAVEVWDLSQSTLDPIIVNTPPIGVKLSTVSFAKNSNCVLVGDSEGAVSVYELRGMPLSDENQAEALQKVIQSSLASQLQAEK